MNKNIYLFASFENILIYFILFINEYLINLSI